MSVVAHAPEGRRGRIERGDWQTPGGLALDVTRGLAHRAIDPRTIIEPTCGVGAFLEAARRTWPRAAARGYEIDPEYVEQARLRLGDAAQITRADFFAVDWDAALAEAAEPLLVLGNPPWVTSAALGTLGSVNLPRKSNFKHMAGLDALTGRANFDVSEWMLTRLLHALRGRKAALAMLVKTIVARRLLELCAKEGWAVAGELRRIDAARHFDASVDAALLTLHTGASAPGEPRWPVFDSLEAERPARSWGCVDGAAAPDIEALRKTRRFEGESALVWRSGVKHDCAKVMELSSTGQGLSSAAQGPVDLEPELVFPLLKGSDVANRRWPPRRVMLVPQRRLGEDTAHIARRAPRTWAYLLRHRAQLAARRSSIYAGQPDFAIFGVGEYTFAPWKVAVAGLYKRLEFVLVGPHEGRPVVFDDTTYFLPFDSEEEARCAQAALTSAEAQAFFQARVFWEDKRPINKRLLQALDLPALIRHIG